MGHHRSNRRFDGLLCVEKPNPKYQSLTFHLRCHGRLPQRASLLSYCYWVWDGVEKVLIAGLLCIGWASHRDTAIMSLSMLLVNLLLASCYRLPCALPSLWQVERVFKRDDVTEVVFVPPRTAQHPSICLLLLLTDTSLVPWSHCASCRCFAVLFMANPNFPVPLSLAL